MPERLPLVSVSDRHASSGMPGVNAHLENVANIAMAGVFPMHTESTGCITENVAALTVCALQDVWDEVRFVRMVERCDGELELVRQLEIPGIVKAEHDLKT